MRCYLQKYFEERNPADCWHMVNKQESLTDAIEQAEEDGEGIYRILSSAGRELWNNYSTDGGTSML